MANYHNLNNDDSLRIILPTAKKAAIFLVPIRDSRSEIGIATVIYFVGDTMTRSQLYDRHIIYEVLF